MKKLIIRSAVYFTVLFVLSIILKRFVATPVILISGAVVLALFNTMLRPLLNLLVLPINVLTLGIGVIFVNILTLLITDGIFDKISISGFWIYTLIAISIMISDGFIRHKRIEEKLS
ncbi:MAG: phage holin family protein [Clostridiales bacterium]|nr:phage holin family protein [Clostridiales bacterium]